MESKEYEELLQKINEMQAEIDQQKSVINEYDSRLKGVKGDLYSQEHRFIPAWLNVIFHYKNKETEHSKEKWSAVLQGFLPGTKSTIVLGGSIVGILTIVLMYQSNQLMALQNQYLQKQIYIQADSDRRNQLVNITEKLYEPSDAYLEQASSLQIHSKNIPIEPKYNSNTRTESLITYLLIKHNPLEQVNEQTLESIPDASISFWNSIWALKRNEVTKPAKMTLDCDAIDGRILNKVFLNRALLSDITLRDVCLKYASLVEAELSRSVLDGANLQGAALMRSRMIQAGLLYANMKQSVMLDADLTKATLSFADLSSSRMDGVILEKAELSNSILKNASLTKSNLKNASLMYATLVGVNLSNADLSGAMFYQADIEGAKFVEAKGFTCQQLMSAINWKLAITDLKCEEPEKTQ